MFENLLHIASQNWLGLMNAIFFIGILTVVLAVFLPLKDEPKGKKFYQVSVSGFRNAGAFYLFALFVLYVFCVIGSFVENFNGVGLQADFDKWGQVGDFFGGMLNPVFAFASFIALLYTIKLQSNEMEQTRIELKQSRIAQEHAADTASNNLRQQKDLVEFEGFKSLLISQLDDLSVLFNKNKGTYAISVIQDVVLAHRLDSKERKSWSQIELAVNPKLTGGVPSSYISDFWNDVAIAKRLVQSMHASASRLQMVGEDSLYRHYVTRVSFYCCMASFTRVGPKVALKADNPVLAEEIEKYWQLMNIEPLDAPKNSLF